MLCWCILLSLVGRVRGWPIRWPKSYDNDNDHLYLALIIGIMCWNIYCVLSVLLRVYVWGPRREDSKKMESKTGSVVRTGLSTEERKIFCCNVALRVSSKMFWFKWSTRRLSLLCAPGQKCCRFVLEKVDGSKREEHILSSQTHFVKPIEGTDVYKVFDIREWKRKVFKYRGTSSASIIV